MGDVSKLGEEMTDELRQAFQKFDKEKKGRINIQELGRVMRYMGSNPSFNELNDMLRDYGSAGMMTVDGFLQMMAKDLKDDSNEQDLIEAFQVFDKDGKGYISVMELRNILLNLGEKLTDSEVEDMLRRAAITGDGSVDYTAFVRSMINK